MGSGTAYATSTTQADVFITQSPNIGNISNTVADDHDPASGTQSGTSRAFAQFTSNDTFFFGSGHGVADTNGAIYARGTVNLTFGNIGILQADGGAETVYDEIVTSSGPVHVYLDFVIPKLELSAINQAFSQVYGYVFVYTNGSLSTSGQFYTAAFDGNTQTLTENKNPGGFTTFTQYDFSCTTSCKNTDPLMGFLDLGVLNNGDTLNVDYVLNARANAGSDPTNLTDPRSGPSPNASAVFGDPSCVVTNLSDCSAGSASLRFVPVSGPSIPEPMTLSLMSVGLIGLAASRRRRRV